MTNKNFGLEMWVMVLGIVGLIVTGCASIQPMSNEAIGTHHLASNPREFMKFQYYVSRDIVLTFSRQTTQSGAVGQVNINRNIIQILSSTPGVVIEVKSDERGNTTMLGVAFEASNTDLLWFVQNPAKPGTYFYLAYTNEATKVINYGGISYTVTYEQATGVGATVARLNPFNKVKKGEYNNMEPILLYEERVRESEQRRNLQGRRVRS